MKTVTRIIIILAAALLVSGATFAFGQTSQASTIINSLSGRSGFEQRGAGRQRPTGMTLPQDQAQGQVQGQSQGQTSSMQPPAGFEGRGGGEMGGFNIAGIGPVLKNAGIMLGICIVLIAVSLVWRALRRGSRKPKAEPLAL